jgi:hypothetical protein
VVEPGIEADLVQQQNAGVPRLAIQGAHLGRDVRRGDERHAPVHGDARDRRVQRERQKRHDEVGLADQGRDARGVVDRHLRGARPGVSRDGALRLGRIDVADRQRDVVVTREVFDHRPADEPRPQDEHPLHGRCLSR